MVEFKLKLAACQRLLSKINNYQEFICDKGYERLSTSNYYKKWFTFLRNSIEGEIEQILESLKAKGIDNLEKTFSFEEVIDCLQNETELKGFKDSINQISAEIFKEAESIQVDIIKTLDSLPDAVADLYNEYQPEEGKLYRHGVYHGLQTDFGTKKNSLRLILLLDRIIFFYAMT